MKEKNNHEVELRALLKKGQLEIFVRKLKEKGALLISRQSLKDVYLCPENIKSFKELEMNAVGSYSLRLRTTGSGKEAELNVKIITNHGDHHAWEEQEASIEPFSESLKIFQSIGFKPYITIEKVRKRYKLGHFSILLEDINDFGPAVEVEILTTKDKAEKTKDEIRCLFKDLGVGSEQILPKSITNVIMKEKSNF